MISKLRSFLSKMWVEPQVFIPQTLIDEVNSTKEIKTLLDNLNVSEEERIECKAGCVIVPSLIDHDIIDVLKQKIATRAANVEEEKKKFIEDFTCFVRKSWYLYRASATDMSETYYEDIGSGASVKGSRIGIVIRLKDDGDLSVKMHFGFYPECISREEMVNAMWRGIEVHNPPGVQKQDDAPYIQFNINNY